MYGLTAGPFLGGVIIGNFGWRWIFFVNVPIGILASLVAFFVLKEGKMDEGKRFDFMGSVAAFAALFTILLALSMGNRWGWQSPQIVGLFVTAAALAAMFIVVERKVEDPMLDLSLFKSRLFTAANISALINYLALFVAIFLIPFYLRDVLGESYQKTGLVLTAVPLTTGIIAPLSGTLSDRIGSRLLSSLGLAITAVALFALSQVSSSDGVAPVAFLLSVIGLGAGIFQSPNTSAIMGAVPRQRLGVAASMQATMRNTGMVLGIALAGAVVATFAPVGSGTQGLTEAIHMAFIIGSVVAGIGVVASLIRGATRADAQEGEGAAG